MSRRGAAEELDDELDEEYEYDEEEEEWDEEPAPAPRSRRSTSGPEPAGPDDDGGPGGVRTLALGFLAMLPLFLVYEVAVGAAGPNRNPGERWMSAGLEALGEHATLARRAALAGCALVALVLCRRRRVAIGAGASRIVLEGLVGGAVLGPLLVLLFVAGEGWLPRPDVSWDPLPGTAPDLVGAGLVLGGGAWEELFFRVGLYSFLYLLTLRFLSAFDAPARGARWSAEVFGLGASSLAFAALHFRRWNAWWGGGGMEFDPALFAWIALSGLFLGLLFRWRGPGVAAWTHGLFNLALWVGVDPDVIAP